jgi:outer membrane lipoprotein carrier protein
MKAAAKFLIMAIYVSYAVSAHADGLEQFNAFIRSTHAAKGEFIQHQTKLVNGKTQATNQSSGTFMFARPGKFIWFYQKPYEQLLQSDGKKLYMYDKDLNQVIMKPLESVLSSSPAAILFGGSDLEKNFVVKDIGKKEDMDFLQATHKDKDSTFLSISIGMKKGTPQKMELRDNFNKTTVILFQNLEKNPAQLTKNKDKNFVDPFQFTVPVGADIFNS